jgi:calcineurin-like phosphoesterase family protein
MNTHFTSDTHFFHSGIISLCQRPYATAEEMNDALISNWNKQVQPEDQVFHLGDVIFSKQTEILGKLNGIKHLICGNHDRSILNHLRPYFVDIRDYCEVKVDGRKISLMHFPIEDWNGRYHGALHLHGHSHGRAHVMSGRLDVGIDGVGKEIGYRPISIQEVLDRIGKFEGESRSWPGQK